MDDIWVFGLNYALDLEADRSNELVPFDSHYRVLRSTRIFEEAPDWRCNMGPTCPHCGHGVEWTVGEVWEDVYADKLYTCANKECYGIFVVALDTMIAEQVIARKALSEGQWKDDVDTYDTKPEDVEWTPDLEKNEDE